MKKLIQCLFVLVACVLLQPIYVRATSLSDAPTVFRAGNWSVLRAMDPMTDKVSCTGIYKDQYGIQLTSDTLYVSIRGGISSIRLRFDDEPVQNLRLATEMEKKVDAISISGADFSKLMDSRRLRVEVLTLVRGVINEDLDLAGIREARTNIEQGCPVTGEVQPKATTAAVGLCPGKVVERLKARGLTDKDTQELCKE